MKTYNKPNTDIHKIELQQMIAATTNGPAVNNGGSDDKVSDPTDILGKKNTLWNSDSSWDEEE
ncbi:MAG: hypothetical protein IJ549_03830 [Prevotella sp.]|nr:hypothetical protein [Prevotella sp.]